MGYSQAIIALSTIAFVVLLPPLAWHSYTRNTPAIILITWLLLMNVKAIVDAGIWGGADYQDKWFGYGWCDIVTKIQIGANVGVSCAVANIAFNLLRILRANKEIPDNRSWKKIRVDLAISLVTPICVMGLIYLVQVFRFGVFRYNGCQSMLSPTWVTTVLYTVWMLIWSMIGFVYATLLLFVFYKKRKDVRDILHCTNSGLNISRFARLLIFCMLIILIMFPFSIYSFASDLKNVSATYRHYSFKETHNKSLWNVILHFDPGQPLYSVWLYIVMSYLVFLIFGLGSDALTMYANFLRTIGLGIVIDSIDNWRVNHRNSRIGGITEKILPITLGPRDNYAEFYCGSSSDGIATMSDCTEKMDSPSSPSQFEIDYTLPYERNQNDDVLQNKGAIDFKAKTFFRSNSCSSNASSKIDGGNLMNHESDQFQYHYRLDRR
ncbi:unnamed protein product [Kluyveromyces dobzhanskii CBS 2104]|uniref:WGS project CCBQ000000000 data, contig 00107 n=1 Tax=Kluyveromyces dobzhanskii CBS 2104 TaxID=1427455 RepID=A0A0A8L0Q3_9SACH|nr:unnamed protein product [Kluyveromyces dobzhanskii CBS 2104]